MTIRELVAVEVGSRREAGITVPEFLLHYPDVDPQSAYSAFSYCKRNGSIVHNTQLRKIGSGKRCTVWIHSRFSGTAPVWRAAQPIYRYSHRTKKVMDLMASCGPVTNPEIRNSYPDMSKSAVSSLLSSLVQQGWIHKTQLESRSPGPGKRRCRVYDLTPRGRQVRQAPKKREELHNV